MSLDLTFKDVCDLLKKDEPKLIEAVDKLLGFALICSPAVIGQDAAALLPTLAVKNELIKIGKGVFDKFSKKKDTDYLAKQQRMQVAYSLLIFTAFFEALDKKIPKELRDKIGLLGSDKIYFATKSIGKACEPQDPSYEKGNDTEISNPLVSLALAFPHPTETLKHQVERNGYVWKLLGQGFQEFVQKLAFWEGLKEQEQVQFLKTISEIPNATTECFEAQYFDLASRYEDFAVWASLQEHGKSHKLIASLSQYVQQQVVLSKEGKESIDIGFAKLHEAVLGIPETLKISQAVEIVESLERHYKARINEPIIEEKDESEEGKPKLSFPKVSEAFIPQSFRVLRQGVKARRLEDEDIWRDLPRRSDLGSFLLSYLRSPYSNETPLVILGHPGSGKSLLTTVISAQLMSKQFTAIRVPLREVDAEAGIVAQIEQRLKHITNLSVDSWAKLSSAFKNCPPLVILDGYDELLQASGKVFSGYLKEVQNFQKNELEQGRPVRVIVTSRITLIDKATIPSGTTILRLLEFDRRQQERWLSIWNNTNANYFREAKVKEFALPDTEEDGAEKILALAEQPLLLLMLALYDSQNNKLRKSKALDRTLLYDSLLRRFVTRERGKDRGFDDGEVADKKKTLDTEMQRLGVAAVGMYNRRTLHILTQELNDDLKFFNLERKFNITTGRPLSQADLLLGSFFFVHKSKAQHHAGAAEQHEETSAFEFLHNTFGEFLTADFVLRWAIAEVEAHKAFNENPALHAQLEQRLNSADGLSREWFASLVYTPLFTRPVVLEMMREWVTHILKERKLSKQEFSKHLDAMVLNQLQRILSKREMPPIMRKETAQEGYRAPFGEHPLLGHIAIYSLNLILLRMIVDDSPFVFNESQIATHEDGARPWDRLTYIWRAWFALDNLNGVTAVMLANREGNHIKIRAKDKFQVSESQNRLETCLSVALSLGDDITSGLTGLLLFEPFINTSKVNKLEIDDIEARLSSEKLDLEFQIAMKRLSQYECHIKEDNVRDYFNAFRQVLNLAMRGDKYEQIELIALSLRHAMRRLTYWKPKRTRMIRTDVLREIMPPRDAGEIALKNPQAALIFCQVAKETGDIAWIDEFRHVFTQFSFGRNHPMEMMERDPVSWLQLVRELGGIRFLERFDKKGMHPEFIERALDPRYILDLSELNPEAALVWLKLARELCGVRFVKHFDQKFLQPDLFERAIETRDILRLIEQNPAAALYWLQLIRELGGERYLERYGSKLLSPEVLERLLEPRFLLEQSERNPESALVCLQLVREMGGSRFIESQGNNSVHLEYLERLLDPRYLLELNEINPEATLPWLQLLRELAGERSVEFSYKHIKMLHSDRFERSLSPRYLLDLAERNPEATMYWLQLVSEWGSDMSMERLFGEEFVERVFNSFEIARLLNRKPSSFGAILRLARLTRSTRALEVVSNQLISTLSRPGGEQLILSTLPVSALADVRWLESKSDSHEITSFIRSVDRQNNLSDKFKPLCEDME